MTELPLHPAFVHIPLGLAVAMPFLAVAVALALWRQKLPRGALGLVAGLQLLLAGSAFVAAQLGGRDEERAERVAPKEAIHAHEEAGEVFLWSSMGVLAVALGALFVPARRAPLAAAVVALGTVVVAALAADTGRKGGELVFRHGAGQLAPPGSAPPAPQPTAAPSEREADHDR